MKLADIAIMLMRHQGIESARKAWRVCQDVKPSKRGHCSVDVFVQVI